MEISPNMAVSATVAQKQADTQEQVQVSMLKKSIDSQSANALSLIANLPNPQAVASPTEPVNPPNLGNHVDTQA